MGLERNIDLDAVRVEYINALWSGEYRQTTGAFARKDASGECYCALGVLFQIQWCRRDTKHPEIWYEEQDMHSALCKLGYSMDDPTVVEIVMMNDVYHWTFSAIADRLEERWNLK